MQFGARAARRCATKITHLMKKYITPNIEYFNVGAMRNLMQEMTGSGSGTVTEPEPSGKSNAAPQRVF